MQKEFRLLFQCVLFATVWVIFLLALSAIIGCGNSGDKKTVTTAFGDVKGYETTDTRIWKGIPYAKPPVGELRWKAPVDPDAWTPSVCPHSNQWFDQNPRNLWALTLLRIMTGSEFGLDLEEKMKESMFSRMTDDGLLLQRPFRHAGRLVAIRGIGQEEIQLAQEGEGGLHQRRRYGRNAVRDGGPLFS